MGLDETLLRWVASARSDVLTPVMWLLSSRIFLGLVCCAWVVWLVVSLGRRAGLVVATMLVVSVGLADLSGARLLKPAFDRPRLCHLDPTVALPGACGPGKSMPSNHAATMSAAATVLVLTRRRRGLAAGVPVALAVGLSRMYLGVHYPSDILAGFALGIVVACAVWLTFRSGGMRLSYEEPTALPRPDAPGDSRR